jgi:hypothetical protein
MRRAQEMFDECCRLCENHGFESLYAANRSMVGWSRLTALEFSEAADDALVAVDRCRTSGHLRGEMNAHALASYVLAEMNRHVEAQAHAREASSLARRLGTRNFDAAVAYFSFFSSDTGAGREAQYAMLQEAAETSRALGHGFHGPAILGGLLLVTDDPGEREEIVREAEATLAGACVGHNYFWFYRDAMQSALDHADWALLDRVRNRFLDIHRDSPTHWVTFYVQRINILERFRRGDVDGSVIDSCRDLIEEGRRHHLSTSLRELENALASVG